MIDLMYIGYPWVKAVHIMAVISWMAGLFYLPRLFVHHTEQIEVGSETDQIFQMMEQKLLKVIMTPAMITAWACGIFMALLPGVIDWGSVWPWVKLLCIILMTGFHMWCSARCRDFFEQKNQLSGKRYRLMNEVPTVLMIIIVISVIVRPF